MKRYVPWLPSIIIMIIIFLFSNKPSFESSKDSMEITVFILDVYENLWDTELNEEERYEIGENLEVIVRKTAHFTEYALLAMAFSYPLWKIKLRKHIRIRMAWILSTFYAITDEVHQLFIPGRSGKIFDVMIDSMGALFGTIIFSLLVGITTHFSRNKGG